MSYAVEWMGGGVVPVYGIVLVLLIVPELAAIAVVVATIAVLVGLVAHRHLALVLVALLAAYGAARRAGRVHPTVALGDDA